MGGDHKVEKQGGVMQRRRNDDVALIVVLGCALQAVAVLRGPALHASLFISARPVPRWMAFTSYI